MEEKQIEAEVLPLKDWSRNPDYYEALWWISTWSKVEADPGRTAKVTSNYSGIRGGNCRNGEFETHAVVWSVIEEYSIEMYVTHFKRYIRQGMMLAETHVQTTAAVCRAWDSLVEGVISQIKEERLRDKEIYDARKKAG